MIVSFNKEQLSTMLREMVVKIKTEEDPLELNEIRRIFRKNVPITMRSYMAAYILKQFVQNGGRWGGGRQGGGESGRSKKERETRGGRMSAAEPKKGRLEKPRTESGETEGEKAREKRPQNRIPLDEALSTTLFLSIGRNRRVFPRDLVALISHAADIDRERIGDIRVLDNYSFVQLLSEDTDAIIAALDGYEYRGRKLSVSYSRKKDEDDDSDVFGVTAEPDTGIPEEAADKPDAEDTGFSGEEPERE